MCVCVCAQLTSALCSPLLRRSLFTGNVRGASCLAAWYRVTQSLFWEEKLACQAGHCKACRQSIKYSICHSNIIDLITQKRWSLKKKAVRIQRRFIGLRDLFKYDLIDSSAPCVRFMGNGMDFLPGKHRANVHIEWKFKSAPWPLGKTGRICCTMEEKGKMSSSNTIHSVSLLFFLFPLAISLVFFFCLYPSCLQAGTAHTVDLMRLCLTIVSVSPWHTAHCFPSLQHRVKYPSSIHLNHMAR